MPKLPSMSSRKLIKLLEKGGAKFVPNFNFHKFQLSTIKVKIRTQNTKEVK